MIDQLCSELIAEFLPLREHFQAPADLIQFINNSFKFALCLVSTVNSLQFLCIGWSWLRDDTIN